MENNLINLCGIIDVAQYVGNFNFSYEEKLCLVNSIFDLRADTSKEDLIRHIVCEGEPADESCVGHPVLIPPMDEEIEDIAMMSYPDKWFEALLITIDSKHERIYGFKPRYGDISWSYIAKKKPGYDYMKGKK